MALAALIAAYHESAEPGALRASLPLAGRTVVERQARLAAQAGARRIIVLVERMPAGLTAALDRLRREGVPLHVARSVAEAAEAVDPAGRLLVFGDGAIVAEAEIARLADGEGAMVLTVPDTLYGDTHERIDGGTRWAGLAAMDGAMLHDTAAMLRDWDLQSTLLRRALQAGAVHVPAEGPVAVLDSFADLTGAERQILEGALGAGDGWASRLLAPLERAVTGLLMGSPVTPAGVGAAGSVLTGLGAIGLAYGWLRTGLALILLATPLDGIALRLARLRMQADARRSWWRYVTPMFAGAGLIGLCYTLATTKGWGTILLGFVTLAFLVAAAIEADGRKLRGRIALADTRSMAWLMLPFAAFGAWQTGVATLFAYAAASFFWAQQEAHRRRPKAGLD